MTITPGTTVLLATRGVGGIEFLREVFPRGALEAFGVLTWLGSVPFVVGLFAVVYWFGVRDRGVFGLATVLGAFALTVALKAVFALPRPPEAGWLIEATGYGFPSGHAIAATVAWGYLAATLDWGTGRQRFGAAGLVVAVVALSRVAVGVHYAVDVVVGVAVGAAYLAILTRIDGADRAFGVATVVSLLALAVTGGGSDAALLLGATAAGALAWTKLSVPPTPWGREGVLPAVGGGGAIGALVFVGYRWDLLAPVEFVVGAVGVALLLGLPVLVERVAGRADR
ncbi:MAG TPA: phosphatase PAP2 family protein [Halobacteriales archaeon]|nr:phosphatase PAP2 family protein [Halobacteriales archaeon]